MKICVLFFRTEVNEWLETPIIPAYDENRVDTNEAGDAIFAGTPAGWIKGLTIQESLCWGTIAAGMCITGRELAHPDLSVTAVTIACQRYYS